jgi:ATP-dependent Clp protease ATP-binding subunit ClpB
MKQEQLTNATTDLINNAVLIAQQHKNPTLQPLHILAAALHNQFSASFFTTIGVPLPELTQLVEQELKKIPTADNGQIGIDYVSQQFFTSLEKEAAAHQDMYISLEHCMIALAKTTSLPESIKALFKKYKFTTDTVESYMKHLRKGKTVQSKTAETHYQVLEKYCQDLTQEARKGKLDPVIGRHEEIRRVIQILSRRTKNNPVLIGQPGVGKTAIVEGIAQRIINNDVPESLKNKKILSLDLGLLVAGTKYQGEFEDRLKSILKEIESGQDGIILFIDELHMLIGAGAAGGGMDASNLLKPALARGLLHCIGATTLAEYKKYIEKDAALERRFQQVLVEEPTIEDAISILRGLKERYELHHGIHIKDQALISAVQLSAKNIPDRFLPDKAIDLVDEAASMVRMSIDSAPQEIDQLERKIRQLEIEKVALSKEKNDEPAQKRLAHLDEELLELKQKQTALLSQWKSEKEPLQNINAIKEKVEQANMQYLQAEREGNYAKASEIKYGTLVKLEQELKAEQEKLKKIKTHLIKEEVDEEDIAKVLSRWTGIPAEKLKATESQKLLTMDQELRKRVIGQDEAIRHISNAIQTHRAGLTDPNRPIGSFLFLGPTGVGKTEIAKALADYLFNDERRLIRIDMSEYMERHAVARLIGAPPGYVGYEEGGQLTEQVRRHPYSIVLFDEIEKAHPEVFNIFLQILDEGHLTDSKGRTVSFKNCILIMTSNIGSEMLLEAVTINDKVKQNIQMLLHKQFKPEFLNRIDAIIYFTRLSEEEVRSIAQLQIDKLIHRLAEQGVSLSVSPQVIDELSERGYIPEFGARPLKRIINDLIVVELSQAILRAPQKKNFTVTLEQSDIKID